MGGLSLQVGCTHWAESLQCTASPRPFPLGAPRCLLPRLRRVSGGLDIPGSTELQSSSAGGLQWSLHLSMFTRLSTARVAVLPAVFPPYGKVWGSPCVEEQLSASRRYFSRLKMAGALSECHGVLFLTCGACRPMCPTGGAGETAAAGEPHS